MSRVSAMVKKLFNRRWWWVTLLVLALMAVLARLGVWQLDRLGERRQANAELMAVLDSPAIDLNQTAGHYLTAAAAELEALKDRDVVVRGRYDPEHQRILILQNYQDRPGVNLITPLLLEDGQTAVLVNRGWIPDAEARAGNWDAYAPAQGETTVAGYVALTETLRRSAAATSQTAVTDEIYRVDVEAIGKDLPYKLLPFYVKESPAAAGDTTPPLRIAREVDLSEGPHLGYAMQWFIFSLGLGIAYVAFVNHHKNPPAA